MESQNIAKYLIIGGVVILLFGIILYFFKDQLNWLGKLPGDFQFQNENVKIYFPLATMIIVSLLLNLIIWLVRRFF